MEFRLGTRVRDKVTGIEGILTARSEFLNGCVRYTFQPPLDKEGKAPDERWVDVGQLEQVDDGIADKIEPKKTGGPTSSRPPKF